MAEVLPGKYYAVQGIPSGPCTPRVLPERLQQGGPISWIHTGSARRPIARIAFPATDTAGKSCSGRLSVVVSPRETRGSRAVRHKKGEVIPGASSSLLSSAQLALCI